MILNLNAPATDDITDDILVKSENGDIAKTSKAALIAAAGGNQNLQQVTNNGNITTNPLMVYSSGVASIRIEDDNMRLTKRVGGVDKTTIIEFDAVDSNVTFTIPNKPANDTFAMLSDLGGAGGDFIPLSGTTEGNPVTGDVQVQNYGGKGLYGIDLNGDFEPTGRVNSISIQSNSVNISNYDPSGSDESLTSMTIGGDAITINDSDSSGNPRRGIRGGQDYSANVTDLDYVQKKYVTLQNSISQNGNAVITGDFSVSKTISGDQKNEIKFDNISGATRMFGKSGVNIESLNQPIFLTTNGGAEMSLQNNSFSMAAGSTGIILVNAPSGVRYNSAYTISDSTTLTHKQYVDTYADSKIQNTSMSSAATTIAPSTPLVKSYIDSTFSTAIVNGGNTTGATMNIGSNDAQRVQFEYNNSPVLNLVGTTSVTLVNGATLYNESAIGRGALTIGSAGASMTATRNTADAMPAMVFNKQNTSVAGDVITMSAAGTRVAGVTQAGDVEVVNATAGVILKSPNGTRYRVTVSDAGVLTTTAI